MGRFHQHDDKVFVGRAFMFIYRCTTTTLLTLIFLFLLTLVVVEKQFYVIQNGNRLKNRGRSRQGVAIRRWSLV